MTGTGLLLIVAGATMFGATHKTDHYKTTSAACCLVVMGGALFTIGVIVWLWRVAP